MAKGPLTLTLDVTEERAVEDAFSRIVAAHGRIDVLVNDVGGARNIKQDLIGFRGGASGSWRKLKVSDLIQRRSPLVGLGNGAMMAVSDLVNLSALLDEAKCFELVRQHRWPQGMRRPGCDSTAVVRNGHAIFARRASSVSTI